ncbi:MAG: hypothetical protein ACOYLQ_12145 [Hyphomicrobiaceae bacterium]|jgi:opacity protein-like surface antigen
MMKLLVATAVSLAALASTAFAAQEDVGLAGMHDLRREGNRLCMSDHWHYGSGGAMPNRKAAQAQAIESWSSFTAFEYGSEWANFAIAGGKTVQCSDGPSGVTCNVSARPCMTRSRKR